MKKQLTGLFYYPRLFVLTIYALFKGKYTYYASALTFSTLFALVPLIVVVISIVALFPVFGHLVDLAKHYIYANFLPASGNSIQHYLDSFVQQAARLPTIQIIFLFASTITLILTVEHALNDILHASKKSRSFSTFLLYWLILITAPLFIGVSVTVSTYLDSIAWFSFITSKLNVLFSFISLFINTCILTALYKIVPNKKIHLKDAFFGGLVAAFLFECGKKGFAFYLQKFHSYELIYGTFALIPIFLLWIYISWLIFLFGALLIHTKTSVPIVK